MRATFNISKLSKLFLGILLLELFLGGGGRLFDFGVVSLRMFLFSISLIFGFLGLWYRPIKSDYFLLVFIWLFMLLLSILVGLINDIDLYTVLNDVKPLLFFLIILFLSNQITSENDVDFVVKLIRIASFLMAIGYIIMFILINFNFIDFHAFYNTVTPSGEFFFRGEFAFFYKGFFYLCVGLFFSSGPLGFRSGIAISLQILAVLLTFTRGFLLSLFLVYLFDLLLIKRKYIYLMTFLMIAILLAPVVWNFVSNKGMLDRALSDSLRYQQTQEVLSLVTPVSILIGHGFGNNLPSRTDAHIEITYLEILHKQGLVGIALFGFILSYMYTRFMAACKQGKKRQARPFFLGVLFAYILSFFNPFITNPIGISMIVLAIVCLNVLAGNR